MPVNALHHPKHDETSYKEGTPVTEKRKRQTRDRSKSDGHADVDEDMHHQQNGNAHGKHGSKAIGCLGRNLQASEDDQKEGPSEEATQQTGFFGQNREDKVIVSDCLG